MSKFNLNERGNENRTVIFNNGIAGRVEDVRIEVSKKGAADADNVPDYRLTVTDSNGAQINQGFYYHKDNSMHSAEKNEANAGYLVDRVLSAARAVVPEDFVFPEVSEDPNEILDVLFNIIRQNASDKTVTVYTTYGTKEKPSRFLGLRFFDFIEKTGNTGYSRLNPRGNDQMERLVEDAPRESSTNTSDSKPASDGGWGK